MALFNLTYIFENKFQVYFSAYYYGKKALCNFLTKCFSSLIIKL